jgi:drug/metabolite transporter (DMT)-like permease
MAILGGLGAALSWALGTVAAAQAARRVGAWTTLAGIMLVGLVIAAPLVVATGVPSALGRRELGWLALAGLGNVVGLLLDYTAFRIGKVGIVAAIASGEGAVAAVLAILYGERVHPLPLALLVVVAVGAATATLAPDPSPAAAPRRAAILAGGAAASFGLSLFATARVSATLPLTWALLPPRAVGVLVITLPLAARTGLGRMRPAFPAVVVSGCCEVAGFASYALGSRHDVAVASVLSAQFAAVAAFGAYFVWRERLGHLQMAGIAMIVAGVTLLATQTA